MREKIYDIIKLWCPNQSYGWNEAMNAICKLLCEEIEKGLLTDVNGKDTIRAEADLMAHNFEPRFSFRQVYFIGCEAQLCKILNLLRPKENVVGNAEI